MARLRLHVLDLGRLRMHSSVLVGAGPSTFPEVVEVPVSAYCIDHPDGRVLFDTGCHPQAMGPRGRWPAEFQRDYPHLGGEECTLPARLEAMGIGPDDIRYVVLSHLHSDHAGCVEFFRKSLLIVHADEFTGAIAAQKTKEDGAYSCSDIDAWGGLDLAWRQVACAEGDVPLHDEVRILNFGRGHAPGMLGLSVRLPETGQIILASDALYCAENLQGQLPGWMEDEAGYRRALARLAALAKPGTQIWFGHDPRQFATLRTSTDGVYE
jgi:glyoxylase-like metal-dependent hydrolase (beta-lactamase superfamily II)